MNNYKKIKELLEAAKCPCCDGSGCYYDNFGEVLQCQWCDEKNEVLGLNTKYPYLMKLIKQSSEWNNNGISNIVDLTPLEKLISLKNLEDQASKVPDELISDLLVGDDILKFQIEHMYSVMDLSEFLDDVNKTNFDIDNLYDLLKGIT